MKSLDRVIEAIHWLDDLAARDTLLTRLFPLAKLAALFLYLGFLTSLERGALLSGLLMLLPLPVLYRAGKIPFRSAFRQALPAVLLLAGLGLVNLLYVQAPPVPVGPFRIGAGTAAFLVLVLKGLGCVLAGYLLLATTGMERLACALQKLPLPRVLIVSTLLTWRYLVLLLQESRRMEQAFHLRAPESRGIPWKIAGSLLGLLFLRSLDRARSVYESMELRGFRGRFPETGKKGNPGGSILLLVLTLAWCLLCRFPG